MSKAIVITAAGEVRADSPSTLEDYQRLVGGWIERIAVPGTTGRPAALMLVNEEGRLQGLKVNDLASRLISEAYGGGTVPILGDVVIVGASGGTFTDPPAWVAEWLVKQHTESKT